jgi:DNA-binding PadR family transcriptional regulator
MTEDLGRWAEPAMLVLASLAGGDRHGYAITQDIATQFDVTLGPGTLYAVIARLEEQGLIEGLPVDGRRRPYRLTPGGADALAAQAARMRDVARIALSRLRLGIA